MFSLKKISTKNIDQVKVKARIGRNVVAVEESYLSRFVLSFLTSFLVVFSGLFLALILSQLAIESKKNSDKSEFDGLLYKNNVSLTQVSEKRRKLETQPTLLDKQNASSQFNTYAQLQAIEALGVVEYNKQSSLFFKLLVYDNPVIDQELDGINCASQGVIMASYAQSYISKTAKTKLQEICFK